MLEGFRLCVCKRKWSGVNQISKREYVVQHETAVDWFAASSRGETVVKEK